jgi:hypothetical protein
VMSCAETVEIAASAPRAMAASVARAFQVISVR